MSIFNCFFKIVWKNKISIFIFMGIFAALGTMFSASSSSDETGKYKDTSISIAVIDRDNSELSAALTAYLGEKHNPVELPDDTEKLQDALFYRNVEYILFISEGFEQNLLNGNTTSLLENVKLPKSTAGIYIDSQIDRYISTVKAYLDAGFDTAGTSAYAADDLRNSVTVELSVEHSEQISNSAYYFQYLAYILTAIIISALSPILIAFNQKDLARRIESSSMKLRERNVQIVLGCIAVSFFIWIVLIAIPFVLYGKDMFTITSALRILNNLVYLMIGVSIAFLLGQLMKTTAALQTVNNVISLGMSFLCGIFVPQELLGKGVLSVSKFLPAYWYIRSNDMLSTAVAGISGNKIYAEGIAVQFGFALAIFAVALVISRQKKINSIV